MKLNIAILLSTLASAAFAAPLQLRHDDHSEDKRVAPVAAGILGVAAGSVANAVITGATKGATSGSVGSTINKFLGGNGRKRSGFVDDITE